MNLQDRAQLIHCGLASAETFDGMSREDIIAIKSDQSEMHTRFVPNDNIQVIRSVDKDERPVFRHVASDESVDAMGDIIQVAGWELERFQKNPQLLWAHDSNGLPIGQVERAHKGRTNGQKALLTESRLHTADLSPMAPTVERLIEAGVLPGVSVGFVPKKMAFPNSEEERKELGLGPFGALFQKQELLELSVVPIPANANALQRRSLERSKDVFALLREQGTDDELLEHVRAALCMTDDESRRIRRRTIVVPDFTVNHHAPVEREAEPEVALEPDMSNGSSVETFTLTSPFSINGEDVLAKALDKLADAIEHLTQKNTAAAEATPEVKPSLPVPDDAGEDFLLKVARAATEQFST